MFSMQWGTVSGRMTSFRPPGCGAARGSREFDDGTSRPSAPSRARRLCVPLDVTIPDRIHVGSSTLSYSTPSSSPSAFMNTPYMGAWALASWNAQGLAASSIVRQAAKMSRARALFSSHDILLIQETHGTGKCRALRTARDCKAFWSPGVHGEAGVGAWVKESFLRKVEGLSGGHAWLFDVVPDRAAILRCWGMEGKVQVGVVYLHTGNSGGRRERTDTMRRLVDAMSCWGPALNIIAGDFNFVVDPKDRFSGDPPTHTGAGDQAEASDVARFLERLGMRELEQDKFTYRFADCRSRLDRVYTNMGGHEWLDRDIGCVALDWDDNTSRHRPVAAYRRSSSAHDVTAMPIQPGDIGWGSMEQQGEAPLPREPAEGRRKSHRSPAPAAYEGSRKIGDPAHGPGAPRCTGGSDFEW